MIAGKLPADRSFEAADGDLEKTPARSTSGLPRRCVDFWASVFGLRARFSSNFFRRESMSMRIRVMGAIFHSPSTAEVES